MAYSPVHDSINPIKARRRFLSMKLNTQFLFAALAAVSLMAPACGGDTAKKEEKKVESKTETKTETKTEKSVEKTDDKKDPAAPAAPADAKPADPAAPAAPAAPAGEAK
jgi:hypothetical protein